MKNFYTFALLKGGSGGGAAPADEPCQYAAAVAWTKQGDDRVIVSVVSAGKEEEGGTGLVPFLNNCPLRLIRKKGGEAKVDLERRRIA